jgi:hypothetical protein
MYYNPICISLKKIFSNNEKMIRHHHLVSGRNLTGFARKLTTTVVEYFKPAVHRVKVPVNNNIH